MRLISETFAAFNKPLLTSLVWIGPGSNFRFIPTQILQNNRMDQQASSNETNSSGSNANVICSTAEDDSKRRREMLNRRPSYRKILNEISSADTAGIHLDVNAERTSENQSQQSSSTSSNNNTSSHIVVSNSDASALAQSIALSSNSTSVTNSHTDQNNNDTAIPLQVNSYLKMIPTTTMQLAGEQDLLPASVQLGNHSSQHQSVGNHGIVQYASSANQEPQFFISGKFRRATSDLCPSG